MHCFAVYKNQGQPTTNKLNFLKDVAQSDAKIARSSNTEVKLATLSISICSVQNDGLSCSPFLTHISLHCYNVDTPLHATFAIII